jgi:hypothetical protein
MIQKCGGFSQACRIELLDKSTTELYSFNVLPNDSSAAYNLKPSAAGTHLTITTSEGDAVFFQDVGKKTLVLDLDETLVHSSFKPILDPDFIIPVEIEGKIVDVYVLKRPLMDEFLAAVGDSFEVVVFTASLSKYADPLLDLLDPHQVIR